MPPKVLFENLYDAYFGKVYAYFGVCLAPQLAEDLAQQTFLNVWKTINGEREQPQNWQAWIFRTAVNIKMDYLRTKYRRPVEVEFSENLDANYADDPQMAEGLVCTQAFSRLDERQQDLILLKYQGLSSSEIGEILGVSASAVRSRLQAAREALSKHLKDCGVELE